jgi:hypothetical protein
LASQLTHYALLEVPEQAGADDLRQAFRRLSKRFHPDTTTLPQARRRYDAELRLARLAASATTVPSPGQGAPLPAVTSVRRALSGGEWLALLLLALALVFSLVLGVGLALARGAAFSTWPSWLPPS